MSHKNPGLEEILTRGPEDMGCCGSLLASPSLDNVFPHLLSELSLSSDSVRGVNFPPHPSVSSHKAITE